MKVVRAVRIAEGLKIFMPNKESCLNMEKMLNELGVKTRTGRNYEIDLWSVYIIYVPENIGTENENNDKKGTSYSVVYQPDMGF